MVSIRGYLDLEECRGSVLADDCLLDWCLVVIIVTCDAGTGSFRARIHKKTRSQLELTVRDDLDLLGE
jgi:hypothetical protein